MKKNNLLFALIIVGLIAFASCKKGDAGIQGVQGLPGGAGPVGPAGKDGSMIYSGSAIPPATLGNVGDYYLLATTGAFYGPKQSSGWGTSFSLSGATGAPGSQVLSGTVDPTATIGSVGDYYLDKAKLLLYGPKKVEGWGVGLELKGKEGNANVKSYITPVFPMNELTLSNNVQSTKSYDVPAVGYSILSNGAVLGFLHYISPNNPNGPIVIGYPLPYTFFGFDTATSTEFVVGNFSINRVDIGKVGVGFYNIGNKPYSSNFNIRIRFIVVEGTTLEQLTTNHPNIDFEDYNQVSKLLKL